MRQEEERMRLSFMTFACPEYRLAELLVAARRYGYDGVEPRVLAQHKHGIEPDMPPRARAEAKRAFKDSGIEIACIATSCTFATNDPAKRKTNRDELTRELQLAADLGAPRIRVFGGRRSEGLSLDDAIGIVAEDILSGADFAARHGIAICLETHDDFSLGKSVGRVIAKANHAAVRANWDLQHPFNAGEPLDETVRCLSGKIAHVHCHDNKDRKAALPGDGNLPMLDQLRALKAEGFAGYLSAELWTEIGAPEYILEQYIQRMKKLLSAL